LKNVELSATQFGIGFVTPAILFVLLVSGVPILYTLYLSVHDVGLLSPAGEFIWFNNYLEVLARSEFYAAIWRGVVFAGGSVAFQVIVGLLLALLLNRSFKGDSIARTLAIFPYLVPAIAVATMWRWMLQPINGGLVNGYLLHWGIIGEPISFFGSTALAMPSVIFANSWKFMSFAFLILFARLQSIDPRLYEQAKISGASLWQMFWGITFPQLRSAIALVVLLRFIWMFNRFDIIYLLTTGGPRGSTTTLPIYIYETTFQSYDLGFGSAATMILFAILSIFAIVYFWKFKPSSEIETR
jgi:multiple sugar transport system permease protein